MCKVCSVFIMEWIIFIEIHDHALCMLIYVLSLVR